MRYLITGAAGFIGSAVADALLARDPANSQRIFDHAQSVYWVGLIAFRRGNFIKAERAFEEYRQLAEQLIGLDPKSDKWRAEIDYAYSNLGTLRFAQGRNAAAAAAFERSLEVSEDVMFKWRLLVEEGRKTGHTYSQPDLIIAATALQHGSVRVTVSAGFANAAAVPQRAKQAIYLLFGHWAEHRGLSTTKNYTDISFAYQSLTTGLRPGMV